MAYQDGPPGPEVLSRAIDGAVFGCWILATVEGSRGLAAIAAAAAIARTARLIEAAEWFDQLLLVARGRDAHRRWTSLPMGGAESESPDR